MDSQTRLSATRYIWTAFFFAMLVVNGGTLFSGLDLNIFNLFISLLIVSAAVSSTGFIWNWGSLPIASMMEESEKNKRRNRLDNILNHLSEEELAEMRHRLTEQEDNPSKVLLTDDGEIVQRR